MADVSRATRLAPPEPEARFLDADARRALAARVTSILDRHGLRYALLRDPGRLLEEGRGDLDLWVPRTSIDAAAGLIEHEATSEGWLVLKRVRRPHVTSLYLYRPVPAASALTVDLFPSIRWLFADVIPEDVLAAARLRVGDLWTIEPRTSALASCLHHLAWNGTVPERYLDALREGPGTDDLPHADLAARLVGDPDPPLAAIRRRLLSSVIASDLARRPLRSATRAAGTLVSLARSRRGWWIACRGPDADRCLDVLDARLHEEHLLVGRRGSRGRIPDGPLRRGRHLARLVLERRLGAIVLSSGETRPLEADLTVSAEGPNWRLSTSAEPDRLVRGSGTEELVAVLIARIADERRRAAAPGRRARGSGIVVALVGPDGSGKSTLAERLASDPSLRPVARYHWRPGVLPRLGALLGKAAVGSDASPARSTRGRALSALRLAYYWADTQLGFATRLRRQRKAGAVIVLERSFLDVAVDPARYGFDLPRWLVEAAVWGSVRPRLVLHLSLPPSVAVARKSELSAAEADRQARWWSDVAPRLADVRTLDARPAPALVAARASEVILGARARA